MWSIAKRHSRLIKVEALEYEWLSTSLPVQSQPTFRAVEIQAPVSIVVLPIVIWYGLGDRHQLLWSDFGFARRNYETVARIFSCDKIGFDGSPVKSSKRKSADGKSSRK